MRLLRPTALVLFSLTLAVSLRAQAPAALPADLDAYVARAMHTFEVPGLALSVVKDGRVLAVKGYGVRKLGESPAVDAQTLFGIASNTKVVTAAALGLLVEEKRIEWDAPVIRYLPWFQMWDPYVTRELTIRDLLVHRSGLGLGAGDLLWWPASTYDRPEIARRLRFIRPATSFRSAYAYDNVLYLVAGEVIEAVSGQRWEDFVTARILEPVGMTTSNVRHSDARRGGNVATPHAPLDGKVRPIAPLRERQYEPCGRDQFERAGHGEVADRLPGARPAAGRLTPVFGGDVAAAHHDRDAALDPGAAARAGAAARKLPRLRARVERGGLSRPEDAHAHGRAARLRVARDDGAGPAARDRSADEPGVWRGIRLDRVPHRRPFPVPFDKLRAAPFDKLRARRRLGAGRPRAAGRCLS